MPEITFLGVTGNQTPTSDPVSFVVKGTTSVLFEAGPSVIRQMALAQIPVSSLDAVFVSHCHGDHSLGFPYLMFSNFTERISGKSGCDTIKVIALPEVCGGLQEMWRFCYPPGIYPNFGVDWIYPELDKPIVVGDLLLTFVLGEHRVPVLAVRVDSPEGSLVYSADTSPTAAVTELATDCDLLIHEAAMTSDRESLARNTQHSTARDAGSVAKASGAKRLMLVHMFDQYVGQYETILAEAKAAYDGEVLVPKPLLPYKIGE